jgi:phosphoserine phosphatase RsbU/P
VLPRQARVPVELLDRTREILPADTAAVLLPDFSSRKLIATAAAGLEEEVRQGVRISVGRGFAGRIAADRQPVVLDRVDHTTVLNPILWAKGIQSMVAGGRMIGVLHVGSLTPREFTGGAVGGRRTRSVRRSFPPNGAGTTLPGWLAAALGRPRLGERRPGPHVREVAVASMQPNRKSRPGRN